MISNHEHVLANRLPTPQWESPTNYCDFVVAHLCHSGMYMNGGRRLFLTHISIAILKHFQSTCPQSDFIF